MKYSTLFEVKDQAKAILAKHGFERPVLSRPLVQRDAERDYRKSPPYLGKDTGDEAISGIKTDLKAAGWKHKAGRDHHEFQHPDLPSEKLHVGKVYNNFSSGHGQHYSTYSSFETIKAKADEIDPEKHVFDGKTSFEYNYNPRNPDHSLAHDLMVDAVKTHNAGVKASNRVSNAKQPTWEVLAKGRLGPGSPFAPLYKPGKYDRDTKTWTEQPGIHSNTNGVHPEHASYFKVYVRPRPDRR